MEAQMGAPESSAAGAATGAAQAHTRRKPYLCFLLRCRLEEGAGRGEELSWRFTVQQVGPDAVRRSFACLSDVEAYLEAELARSAGQMAGSTA
jgi:hypothetical protein